MSEEAKFKRVILKYQYTVESKHRDDYAVWNGCHNRVTYWLMDSEVKDASTSKTLSQANWEISNGVQGRPTIRGQIWFLNPFIVNYMVTALRLKYKVTEINFMVIVLRIEYKVTEINHKLYGHSIKNRI